MLCVNQSQHAYRADDLPRATPRGDVDPLLGFSSKLRLNSRMLRGETQRRHAGGGGINVAHPVIDLSLEWRGLNGADACFRDSVHFTVAGNRGYRRDLAKWHQGILRCPIKSRRPVTRFPNVYVPMGYIVAFNRDRDLYQVPLALAEVGLLDCLCTDFYSNPAVWYTRLWERFRKASRQIDGLDSRLTRNVPTAIIMQAVFLALGLHRWIDSVEPVIGEAAAKAAVKCGADLFLYSGFAQEAFCHPTLCDRRKILFYYHPHSAAIREILFKDMERFPALKNSHHWDPDLSKPRANRRKDIELIHADLVICTSSFTRRTLEAGGFGKLPLCVVPYGFETTKVLLNPLEKRGPVRFLFVGQGVQRKGLHHLMEAWRRTRPANATLDVVASVIDPAIRALAPSDVNLRSRVTSAELRELYRKATIFVMPSLVEGFGLVYLEALAAGCHCIYTPNTGVPDLGLPTHAATEVLPGDLDALCAALTDTARKARAGELDPILIQSVSEMRPWPRFRKEIVAALTEALPSHRRLEPQITVQSRETHQPHGYEITR